MRLYDKFKPFADECREQEPELSTRLPLWGHSMSDPQKYRTKEGGREGQEKDSIDNLAAHLLNERKSLTEQAFAEMQALREGKRWPGRCSSPRAAGARRALQRRS